MMPISARLKTIASAFLLSFTFLLASCGEAPKPEKKVEEKPKANRSSLILPLKRVKILMPILWPLIIIVKKITGRMYIMDKNQQED